MSVTLSAPVKIFALVALLAVLGGAGAMVFMAPADVETSAASMELPTKKAGVLDAPAAAKGVAGKADAVATKKAKAGAADPAAKAPAAKPGAAQAPAKPKPKPAAKPKPEPAVAANGLPGPIAAALRTNDIVVVSLWGSGGKIDALARDEAAAGAAAVGAAFVPLNVIANNKMAEALTLKLGVVLRTPTVLVYRRPEEVAVRLDGFRDRETVAQSVLTALR